MTNIVSALTARTQLGQILKRVKTKNERFLVDRRGEPQAIIMSIEDYIKIFAPPPAFLERVWADSERRGTNKLTMRQINAEISAARRQARQKKSA